HRGDQPRADRDRNLELTDLTKDVSRTPTARPQRRTARMLALPAAIALALTLAGCITSGTTEPEAKLTEPRKQVAVTPAAQREHERILAAYNGVYNDPRIEGLVDQTVVKLVAASARPDQHYRITVLNSPTVNAFALPNGQLYVTRGLIALANDQSELA